MERFRGNSFVFTSSGGSYEAVLRRAFIEPFEEAFGIDVDEETDFTTAMMRSMLETENVTWHVIDDGQTTVYQLGSTGILEELDFSIIDNRDFLEIDKTPWCAGGGITFSEVLAYNTYTYPDGLPDMSAFYDTERFPGRRSWAFYSDITEVFLLLGEDPSLLDTAEGRAALSSLIDEELDHAYELFDQHKDQISLFWQAGSDCPQLLISGELNMWTAWNGRIFDAAQEGEPIAIRWHSGHKLNTGSWFVPKAPPLHVGDCKMTFGIKDRALAPRRGF